MITLIILWYVVGIVSHLRLEYETSDEVSLGDIISTVIIGILGFIMLIIYLIIHFDDTIIFKKKR